LQVNIFEGDLICFKGDEILVRPQGIRNGSRNRIEACDVEVARVLVKGSLLVWVYKEEVLAWSEELINGRSEQTNLRGDETQLGMSRDETKAIAQFKEELHHLVVAILAIVPTLNNELSLAPMRTAVIEEDGNRLPRRVRF
jgi:hypothetical protein